MKPSGTPIAIFTYNRPTHADQLLQSLSRCSCLDECSVQIYCDGSKDQHDQPAVEATRRIVAEWADRLGAKVINRTTNLGLADSIVAGVTEQIERYGRVIALEDDFVLAPDFLNYMLQSLDRYSNEPKVLQISGYMFAVNHRKSQDAFFLPVITTCGWATWARAWKHFKGSAIDAPELLQDATTRDQFDLEGNYPYSEMLMNRLAGRNQSWGVLWQWAVFRAGGLVLHPRESLLWVGGFDGSGTHSGTDRPAFHEHHVDSFSCPRFEYPLRWPDEVAIDAEAFKRFQETVRTGQEPKQLSLPVRLHRRIKKGIADSAASVSLLLRDVK